jgi:5-methylthioribose kinase
MSISVPFAVPYYLQAETPPGSLHAFLADRGWLQADERVVQVSRAGEGNMNLTLRVVTNQRSFILKQSRPWVEKYPRIAAPEDRLLQEVAFYRAVADLPDVAVRMPQLLQVDEAHRVAVFQDLGLANDYTFLYRAGAEALADGPTLCHWLSALHRASFPEAVRSRMANREMRQLNHEHLFHFPLVQDNGLPLDAITLGLQAEADRLKRHGAYVAGIERLGQCYLADGPVLLHGDFYPGSWLYTPDGPAILDPEFGFFGEAEYDVGVFIGHLLLAGAAPSVAGAVFAYYVPPGDFNRARALQYAGMELMRRLIGVAQLPLSASLARKIALLRLSKRLVLNPPSA